MGTVWAGEGGGALVYVALLSWLDIRHGSSSVSAVWTQLTGHNMLLEISWGEGTKYQHWWTLRDLLFHPNELLVFRDGVYLPVKPVLDVMLVLITPSDNGSLPFPLAPSVPAFLQYIYRERSCSAFLCMIQWKVGQRGGESGPSPAHIILVGCATLCTPRWIKPTGIHQRNSLCFMSRRCPPCCFTLWHTFLPYSHSFFLITH